MPVALLSSLVSLLYVAAASAAGVLIVMQGGPLAIFGAVIFALVAFGGLRILLVFAIYVPVLRRIVNAIEIDNISAADISRQSARQPGRFGEGLADSFDIGFS